MNDGEFRMKDFTRSRLVADTTDGVDRVTLIAIACRFAAFQFLRVPYVQQTKRKVRQSSLLVC